MNISSFLIGYQVARNGSGGETIVDGVDPYYQKLAEALMSRNAEYLSDDEKVLSMKGFKLSDGSTLASLREYSFAGFAEVEGMTFSDVVIISENAFAGCDKLKILDITASEPLPSVNMYPGALNGCTALEALIIRDGANGLTAAAIPSNHGGNDTFCVYVPSMYYDEVIAKLNSNHISSGRYRKLEDHPEIDNWNKTFTVNFYDGDKLVGTETVRYGKDATFKYVKAGCKLVQWSPMPTNVTADMDCYGLWAASTFEKASWDEIHALTEQNLIGKAYSVGDTKSEVLTYVDGTTENIEFVIAHINTDGRMVLALNHALATKKQMHSSASGSNAIYFRQELYSYLTNTVYPALSEELRSVIEPISDGLSSTYSIFLPTLTNCGTVTASDMFAGIGDWTLDLFGTASQRIRKLGKGGTTATEYWLGTYYKSSGYYYYQYIGTDGEPKASSGAANGLTGTKGVIFLVVV